MNMRVVYDAYLLVYYELLGITVTDHFIKNLTGKVFDDRFLSY